MQAHFEYVEGVEFEWWVDHRKGSYSNRGVNGRGK